MTSEHGHGSEVPDFLPENLGEADPLHANVCPSCQWLAEHYGVFSRPLGVMCQPTCHLSLASQLHLSVATIEREIKEGRLRGVRVEDFWLIHGNAVLDWLAEIVARRFQS